MRASEYILPLADPRAILDAVGGKGASLARLVAAGLPVPDGFHVTTAAYQCFVAGGLRPAILEIARAVDPAQPSTLEVASRRIADLFASAPLPSDVAQAVAQAYSRLPGQDPAVGVRSSATAEDLPDLSFAGQQETYLNVHGVAAVQDAVRRCWASLWTARAIGYRAQHGVDQDSVSLAVVVQLLVPAEASGVLFTANPVSGSRDQAMITAAWGLGEAIVGGAVTPDTLTLDKASCRVISREIADKQVMTVPTADGTEERPTPESLRRAPALDDRRAAELTRLGVEIERIYGMPMDVEWALARPSSPEIAGRGTLGEGGLYVLQARPITALPEPEPPPPTAWPRPDPRSTYLRGSLAEQLPNPLSPLFATLGLRMANIATSQLGQQFPGAASAITEATLPFRYTTVNGYAYMEARFAAKDLLSLLSVYFANLRAILGTSTQRWRESREALRHLAAAWDARPVADLAPSELLEGARELTLEASRYFTAIQSGTIQAAGLSELAFTLLFRLIKREGDPDGAALLYGFDTIALRAEKSLFDLATLARARPALADYARRASAERLAADLRGQRLPEGVPTADWTEWKARFDEHLEEYGRTAYDFDFATPTPAETPEALLDVVKAYLEGRGVNPYERQREAVARRQRAAHEVGLRFMPFPRSWFRKSLGWAQEVGPLREDSLADLGLAHPAIRRLLGELGRRFAAAGAIDRSDDVYWLVEDEARELADLLGRGESLPVYRERARSRRAEARAQGKAIPPALLPERSGWSWMMPWARETEPGTTLKGVGTSRGRVTATARVLSGPEDFARLEPGDVLVAVTTTPAWTPLFTLASAVVTDIGGPLSHTSIVAREYGIPAVMATGFATRRIKSGDVITVDGGAGVVILPRAVG